MIRLFSPLLGLVASNAHANHPAILEKDFRTMMAWFLGVYGNQEQVYFEAEQKVDQALRHKRIDHFFAPVDLPAFDEHVLYVPQHLNDDPSLIYSQQIYVFRPD